MENHDLDIRFGNLAIDDFPAERKNKTKGKRNRVDHPATIYLIPFSPQTDDLGISLEEGEQGWMYCKVGYSGGDNNGEVRRKVVAKQIQRRRFKLHTELNILFIFDNKYAWEKTIRDAAGKLVTNVEDCNIRHVRETVLTRRDYLEAIIAKTRTAEALQFMIDNKFERWFEDQGLEGIIPRIPITAPPKVKCKYCGDELQNKKRLENHLKKCPEKKNVDCGRIPRFRCHCGKPYQNEKSFNKHRDSCVQQPAD